MTRLHDLTNELIKRAPVEGVAIGVWEDKTTWRIDFAASATSAQKTSVDNFIASYNPDMPTINDVRAEAERRIILLVGARDGTDLNIKIQNALRESARLLQKEIDGTPLTANELARKQTLSQLDAAIESIRAKSNALEVMSPIPNDYQTDIWW